MLYLPFKSCLLVYGKFIIQSNRIVFLLHQRLAFYYFPSIDLPSLIVHQDVLIVHQDVLIVHQDVLIAIHNLCSFSTHIAQYMTIKIKRKIPKHMCLVVLVTHKFQQAIVNIYINEDKQAFIHKKSCLRNLRLFHVSLHDVFV